MKEEEDEKLREAKEMKRKCKPKNNLDDKNQHFLMKIFSISSTSSPFHLLDGPAVVYVNIFVRSISKIDDVVMVSDLKESQKKPSRK
jgi:hypothetical protein